MIKFYVYKITNLINNKIYIGKSINPAKRWASHIYTAKNKSNKGGYKQLILHKAICKYGSDNFKIEIIAEYDSDDQSLEGEKFFIKKFKSNDLSVGYNLTEGGEGTCGYKLTDEHKKNISIKNSGKNNGQYGKIYSIQERSALSEKISKAKMKNPAATHIITPETIDKLKLAVKEKSSQKLSDEQKDQIIEMYNCGKYIKRDLAILFDVEEKTIKYIIRHWKEVKNNKSKYLTDSQKEQIISLYLLKAYTKQQISDMVDIPFNRVASIIKIYLNKLRTNKQT